MVNVATKLAGPSPVASQVGKRRKLKKVNRVKAETEALGGGDITVETEVPTRGKMALEALVKSTHHQGKELAVEGMSPSEEYGWPYPHHVDEIDSKIWDRLRMLLIGFLKVGP
ncbi:uncharacterized protein A4U43_C04F30100 [Asparagus officinalis]|uniref:Uncharacterized protein n=1 Tax=Asparagus officinalis TaxID=4686 RepID=A0A5P1F4P3_ASPOF|nr:uncharacterized protein A4U43_C04F30100 [Asparagus officinalis]